MRILKYVFLLILLGLVALTVYVATQKGTFSVSRSVLVGIDRPTVFRYVNDYGNFESWSAWKEDDPAARFRFSEVSSGKGAWVSWETDGGGKLTSTAILPGETIEQKASFSGHPAGSRMRFADSLGKTKVTWHIEGKVDFMTKVNATFNGGVSQLMEDRIDRSLERLRKTLTHEINTFSVKVNGLSRQPGGFYLKQTISCRKADAEDRIAGALARMERLFRKQGLKMKGYPFVVYEATDPANGTVTFSVCGPLKEEIYLAAGSDVSVGFLEPFHAVKVTLQGDRSHRNAALGKGRDWMKEKGLSESPSLRRVDVYVKSAPGTRAPSQWVTELLLPTGQAAIATPPTTPSVASTPTTNGPATSTSTSSQVNRPSSTPSTTPARPATRSAQQPAQPAKRPATETPATQP